MGDAVARPYPELQPALQLEERDRAVLELLADDALGLQAQAVAVEPQRPLQVVHAERDERDPGLHAVREGRPSSIGNDQRGDHGRFPQG
jgi:hypothetical protein